MDYLIGKEQAELILQLAGCLERLGWDYALIGAMSLIVQGIELGRVTKDLDFTVLVSADIKRDKRDIGYYLQRCGLRETRIPHRYEFKDMFVDVIPIFEKSDKLFTYWSTGEKMSIAGYRDAIVKSTIKEVETDLGLITIKVAPVPLIVFLKLVACFERMESSSFDYAHKHLNDILKCLEQYEFESDRKFDFVDEVGWAEDQFDCAGAFLLGIDLKRISSHEIRSVFNYYLEKCCSLEQNEFSKMLLNCLKSGFDYENEGAIGKN